MGKYFASVISDVHTSSSDSAWKGSSIRGDARWSLKQFVDISVRNDVTVAIALGDLLDKSANKTKAIEPWVDTIDVLTRHGIQLVFIQGNHDQDDPPWLSAVSKATLHLHQQTLKVRGKNFYGFDFQPERTLAEEIERIPEGTDYLLCHQGWKEFLRFEQSYQGSLTELHNTKNVLTGDLHHSLTETVRDRHGKRMCVESLGASSMQSVSDPIEHYVGLLSSSGLTRVPLVSRKVIKLPPVNISEDLIAVLAGIKKKIRLATEEAALAPEDIRKPIVILEHTGVADAYTRASAVIDDSAHLFCRRVLVKTSEEEEQISVNHGSVSLRNCLNESLGEEGSNKQLRQLLVGMLEAENPAEFEQQFREDFMNRK